MGNLCSCFQRRKKECLITLLGLEEDQRRILVHMVGKRVENDQIQPYSNYKVQHSDLVFDIHSISSSENIGGIREIHKNLATAIVYSIDADVKASIEMFRLQINESTRTENETVLVLCRANNIEDPNNQKIKTYYHSDDISNYEFLLYNENTCGRIKKGFNWLYDKFSGGIRNDNNVGADNHNSDNNDNSGNTGHKSKAK